VAGLGNIYVSEALFRSHISPKRLAGSLKPDEIKRLVPAIKKVLQDAIKVGGSSLRDHARPDGNLGEFQHHFLVYDREGKPCKLSCKGTVRRIVQAGRSTFYCPKCQK
jgi:formamidopyrimidine-DNA glycosylase